jgi:type IV pilus assembly protein PilB
MSTTREEVVAPGRHAGGLSKEEVGAAKALAKEVGLEYVDLDRYPLNAAAAALIPEQVARSYQALAVGWKYGTPVVAVAAPDNVIAMDDVRTIVGRDIHAVVACASQIEGYVDRLYGHAPVQVPQPPRGAATPMAAAPMAPPDPVVAAADPAPAPAEPIEAPAAAPPPPPPPPPPPSDSGRGAARAAAPAAEAEQAQQPQQASAPAEAPPAPADARQGAPEPVAVESPVVAAEAPAAPAEKVDAAAAPDSPPPEAQKAETQKAEAAAEAGSTAAPRQVRSRSTRGSAAQARVQSEANESAQAAAPPAAEAGGSPADSDQSAAGVDPAAGAAAVVADTPDAAAAESLAAVANEGAAAAEEAAALQLAAAQAPIAPIDPADAVATPDFVPSVPRIPRTPPPESFDNVPALAELLLASGQVTRDEMRAALRESNATGRALGEILGELGLVTEEDLIRAMAIEIGLEFVDLNEFEIDVTAVELIPEAMARRHRVLALGYRDGVPIVGMANPSDVFALDDLRTVIGRDVHTVVCSEGQINDYIQRHYRHDQEADMAARTAAMSTPTATQITTLTDLQQVVEDAPIVKYVNLILRQALNERASDIHIDPTAEDLRVRFRIDGVLHDVTRSPKAIQGGVITRLKVMASLDIAEHRLPQDGRISLSAGSREIDLRVATLPTVHGEMVTLRVLDKANAMLDLGKLGFLPEVLKRYETAYRKPYGTILVTGPTGSGKSTTLYSTCNILNHPERNLVTVEDPVEYQLRGINQVQVNPKAGLGFAAALRSILRTDPDIILVGEIRDKETATIAIEAALTGHLLLSSLHTNDAAGTPLRLIEMGLEPFLVGSALDCVVAQRLARQLCDACAEPYSPSEEELADIGWSDDLAPDRTTSFRRAVGCQACSRTGYRGRLAIHEIMLASEEIERLVIRRTTTEEIKQVAIEQGMTTLRQDGLKKAALGLTSVEEVLRVVV